jgi:hypothetical protein
LFIVVAFVASTLAFAQEEPATKASSPETMQQKVERLANAVSQEELELEASRKQIQQLRLQVAELQADVAASRSAANSNTSEQDSERAAAQLSAEVSTLREQADMEQNEIAIHEQTKVESESKFPVKLTGLILMNAFANSAGVDVIQSPAVATDSGGTTGLSLRQTVLGLDARGPHLFGATSAADVRIDFFGGLNQAGYLSTSDLPRLRTAHAELSWNATRAFIEMDRPIVNPNAPTSLAAIAQPALAWSGNLWNWIPQAGVERSFLGNDGSRFTIEGAIADVPDPPAPVANNSTAQVASLAEQSRWPGSEARLGYARGDLTNGLQLGVGGYFSPHSAGGDAHFDAWASTIDFRVPLSRRFELSGDVYRGSALGGLGGGAFNDYIYQEQEYYDSYTPIDDAGGWAQLKVRANERLEFNADYGIDNAFAGELRAIGPNGAGVYQNLARNSTVFSNIIFSPTAYTLFSFEYRRIDSSPIIGPHYFAGVYGVAAGYRF